LLLALRIVHRSLLMVSEEFPHRVTLTVRHCHVVIVSYRVLLALRLQREHTALRRLSTIVWQHGCSLLKPLFHEVAQVSDLFVLVCHEVVAELAPRPQLRQVVIKGLLAHSNLVGSHFQ